MRNKKEFRDGVLERYNREKRRREVRRKNMTSAVCSLCMVFVILLSGSAYLSAAFGASLFVDLNILVNDKPDENFSPGESPITSYGNEAEVVPNPSETSNGDAGAFPNESTQSDPTLSETGDECVSGKLEDNESAPETTRAPEWTMAPETTRAPEWTKAPETEKPANTTNPPAIETIKPAETTRKPTVTTKAPEWTKAPETTKTPQCTVAPDTNRVDIEENLSPSGDRSDETEPPKCESDGADFWRFLILGSAGVCLAAACVFVYKAMKKEK